MVRNTGSGHPASRSFRRNMARAFRTDLQSEGVLGRNTGPTGVATHQ